MKRFLFFFFIYFGSVMAMDPAHLANQLNLRLLSKGNPWTYPGVHQVYADKYLNKAMLVVEKIPGKVKSKLLDMGSYLVYQFSTDEASFTSVAFLNFSKTDLSFLKDEKKTSGFKSLLFRLNPVSSARAECQNSSVQGGLPHMGNSSIGKLGKFYNSAYWETASGCLMGVLEGVYESTVGLGSSLWEGAKELAVDPAGFWDDRVEQFQTLKNFFLNFEASMQEFAGGVSRLPDSAKAQLFCGLVGGLGTDILASIFLGGAGLGAVVGKMGKYLKQVSRIGDLVSRLSRLGRFSHLPKEFFMKLVNMSEGAANALVGRMRAFGANNMDEMAIGLARCSI